MTVEEALNAIKGYIRGCEEQINSEFGTDFPMPQSYLDEPYALVDALVAAVRLRTLEEARLALVAAAYTPTPFPEGLSHSEKNWWGSGRKTMFAQGEAAIESLAMYAPST